MSNIWVISDTHFGHDNIYTFKTSEGDRIRPLWTNAQEADEAMLTFWNELVAPTDKVYHLGDVSVRQRQEDFIAFSKQLHGHKRLILGNHDDMDLSVYRDAGFQKIFSSRNLQGKVLLTHIPVHPKSIPRGCVGNCHGHIHEKAPFTPKHFNASVERTGFRPIPFDLIVDQLGAAETSVERALGDLESALSSLKSRLSKQPESQEDTCQE